MAAIGNLFIKIKADHTGLKNDLRQAGRSVGGFSSSIGKMASSFLPAATAAGVLGAAVGAFRKFKQIAADIDAVAKSARLLGVELRDLEGLKFAGELAGVDDKKVIGGIKTMQKRIGEAARGSGAALPALEELGLKAEDLVGQDAIKSLIDIADAMSAIEEPAKRAAIAANIFSKGNMEMLLLLKQGGDSIRGYIARMQVISSVTSENAKAFELFNDRMATASMLSGEFWKDTAGDALKLFGIVTQFNPMLGMSARFLDDMGGLSEDLGDDLEDLKAIGAFEELGDDVEAATAKIKKLEESARKAGEALLESLGAKLDLSLGVDPIDRQIKDVLTDAFKNLPFEEFLDLGVAIRGVASDLKAAEKAAEEMKEATRKAALGEDFIKGLEDAIALETGLSPEDLAIRDLRDDGMDPWKVDQAKDLVKELEQAKKLTADMDLGESLTAQFRTPLEEFKKVAEDLDRLLDVGAIDEATAGRALAGAEEDLAASAKAPEVFAGRAEVGSAEAYRVIARAQAGGAAISPQEKILAEGKKQTQHLSNLADIAEKGVEILEPNEVAESPP